MDQGGYLDKKIYAGFEQRWGGLPTVAYLRFFDHHTDIWWSKFLMKMADVIETSKYVNKHSCVKIVFSVCMYLYRSRSIKKTYK